MTQQISTTAIDCPSTVFFQLHIRVVIDKLSIELITASETKFYLTDTTCSVSVTPRWFDLNLTTGPQVGDLSLNYVVSLIGTIDRRSSPDNAFRGAQPLPHSPKVLLVLPPHYPVPLRFGPPFPDSPQVWIPFPGSLRTE